MKFVRKVERSSGLQVVAENDVLHFDSPETQTVYMTIKLFAFFFVTKLAWMIPNSFHLRFLQIKYFGIKCAHSGKTCRVILSENNTINHPARLLTLFPPLESPQIQVSTRMCPFSVSYFPTCSDFLSRGLPLWITFQITRRQIYLEFISNSDFAQLGLESKQLLVYLTRFSLV